MKNVAVVGASGAVGDRMIRLLEERAFPVASIKFLASERSAGKTVTFRGEDLPDRADRRGGVPRASTSSSRARPAASRGEWSPIAAEAGAVVVDNSSAFRMDPDVPLVVPEVNPHDIAWNTGDHRQPQLLDDPDGRRAQAAARRRAGAPGRREHLPVGLGRRA